MLVDFYHLDRSPLEKVLPQICEKVLAGGERLLVVAGADLLPRIDALLWGYEPEAFLPHGREDAAGAEQQPILLSGGTEALNGAANIALAEGEWREEALGFARTFYFFDGAHLDAARSAWRSVKANPEAEPRFWKQDERGKWVLGP